jgi:hypothetical protein
MLHERGCLHAANAASSTVFMPSHIYSIYILAGHFLWATDSGTWKIDRAW